VHVGGLSPAVSLDAYSRRTVIINVPQARHSEPRNGTVDFNDEPDEQAAHTGPPPNQKFKSILPSKYSKPAAGSGGPQLEDPLASHFDDRTLAWRLGARIGGGITLDGDAAISVAALAQRPLDGPLSLAARAGWTHRRIDAATVELGVGVQLAATPSLVLTAGGALRGEVRVQDHLAMEDVARVGVGGAASLDLAILSIPLAIGLRIEPAFTELAPGTRAHAALLELGYDWR